MLILRWLVTQFKMRVCNNRWVINISQFLEINFLICDHYEEGPR